MKIGDRDYQVTAIRAGTATPAEVGLEVKVWGMAVASERITPDQARELAQLLHLSADLAEGVVAGAPRA